MTVNELISVLQEFDGKELVVTWGNGRGRLLVETDATDVLSVLAAREPRILVGMTMVAGRTAVMVAW